MLKNRFRKYLPVVVDLETGGFDSKENAILEIAITLIEESENTLLVGETHRFHIEPYEGLVVEDESLEFTKINLNHPLRNAVPESHALQELFTIINKAKAKYECSRAILVGHNAHFLATNQTVLARICDSLSIDYDSKEAHSAAYDSDVTAKVFCRVLNDYSS